MSGSWSTTWQGWQCPPAPGERAASSSRRIRRGRAQPQHSAQRLQQLSVTPHLETQKPGPEDEQGREEGLSAKSKHRIWSHLGCPVGQELIPGLRAPTASHPLLHRGTLKNQHGHILPWKPRTPSPESLEHPVWISPISQARRQLGWGQFPLTVTVLLDGSKPCWSQQEGAAVSPQEEGTAMGETRDWDLVTSSSLFAFFPSLLCSSSHPMGAVPHWGQGLLLPLPPVGRVPCSPAPPWQEPFCLVFASLQE